MFDPTKPIDGSLIAAGELRNQFNGLKFLIDAVSRPASPPGGEAASMASGEGEWKLVIEATMFVTGAVVNVWTGRKPFSNDPTGQYTRIAGCDPITTITIENH